MRHLRKGFHLGGLSFLLCLLPAAGLAAQSAEALYQAGVKAFQERLYPMAGREFRQLVEEFPDSALADDADYLRGIGEFYLEDYRGTVQTFRGFAGRYPLSPYRGQIPYWLGAAYQRLGQAERALEQLEVQISAGGQNPGYVDQALLLKGSILEAEGRWPEAADTYRVLAGRESAAKQRAGVLYRLGSAEYRLERYREAERAFARVLVDYPDSPDARAALFYAAESSFWLGEYAAAERRYRLVLQAASPAEQRETALARLGRLLGTQGRASEALDVLEELERSFPSGPHAGEAARLRADALFDLGRYGEAAGLYEALLSGSPQGVERQTVAYNLAQSYLALGREREAVAPLRQALTGEAEVAEKSLFLLGAALSRLGSYQEAAEALERYVALYPSSGRVEESLRLLGTGYQQAGRPEEAERVFTRLITYYPDSRHAADYRFLRGSLRLQAGDGAGALSDFFAVVQRFPDSEHLPAARYNIGYIYSQRDEYARALPYFEQVLTASDGQLRDRTLVAAGVCSYNLGDYQQALQRFRSAVSSPEPQWRGQGWISLGRTYYRMGRLAEAAEAFGSAAGLLEGQPDGEEALFWKGLSLFRLERLEEARRSFLEVAASYPRGRRLAEAFYRAGLCAALAGDHPAGIRDYDRALAAGPERSLEPEILFRKGLSLYQVRGRRAAQEALERLASRYPESPLVPEGLFKLAEADYQSGAVKEALAGFARLSQEYPRAEAGSAALYWAGRSARALDKPAEALRYWLAYLERAPEGQLASPVEEEMRSLVAELAAQSSRPPASLERFFREAESSPSLKGELKDRVRLEHARLLYPNDPEEAFRLLTLLRSSSLAEPLRGEVYLLIGRYYLDHGQGERALEVFQGITAGRADAVAAQAQLGAARALEALGRRKEAAEEFLKVHFLFPEAAPAAEGLYQAARLYGELGDRQRSEELFRRLRESYPDSEWSRRSPQ